MNPETFRPSPKGLWMPAFFVVLFLAWSVFAAAIVLRGPIRLQAWPAYVITNGVPVAMLVLSVGLLLSLRARLTIDDDGIRTEGPLRSRAARWADVTGQNVAGTTGQGVTLYLRNGRNLPIAYAVYEEGDRLRRRIETEIARLPAPGVEGREFRMASRKVVATLLLGMMAFFGLASVSMQGPDRASFLLMVGLCAALTLPLVAYMLTDRVVLRDGTLIKSSCFGTKRLPLAEVREAKIALVSTKGGMVENLVLNGPVTMRISAQREGYTMLRDAIVRELPPSARPALEG